MTRICMRPVELRALCALILLTLPSPARAADPKLPDLIMWANQSVFSSQCYLYCGSISTTIPNRVVWRFNATTANIATGPGAGPLEIREVTHPDPMPPDPENPRLLQDIYQRIYDTEGGWTDELITTIPDPFAIAGRHLFLTGFSQYNLRTVLPDGGVGPIVSSHDKTSSGIVDSTKYSPEVPGAPSSSQYTNVTNPNVPMGISIGWADIYQSNYPNQWVDVTGLTPGQYWLEVITDPYQIIQESNETNNTTQVLINIPSIPSPTAKLGDYNLNGSVDTADYVVWRKTLGQLVSAGTSGDGDADGRVFGPDYAVWQSRYGVVPSSSAEANIPEPNTLVLLLGVALVAFRRRRREI